MFKLKSLLCAALLAVSPLVVGATTLNPADGDFIIVSDGDIVNIAAGVDFTFAGTALTDGGSGSFEVTFDAISAGSGFASVSIGVITAGAFENLWLSWIDDATNAVLSSVAFAPVTTFLPTVFSNPDQLVQRLLLSWDESSGTGFDLEGSVSTIPVPAAGFLLMGALGGLGFVGRRRRKAA